MGHKENEKLFADMLDQGFHCSQCVARYWATQLGLDEELALRMVSGLGLGENHGDTCGAVSVTAMMLGAAYGFADPAEKDGSSFNIEERVRAINVAFKEKNGSLLCRELLTGGYDGADPDAKEPEGVDPWENCAKYCADAVEIATEQLENAKALVQLVRPEDVEQASPVIVGAGCGIGGVALGAIGAGVIAYERRRAENENL